MGMFEQFWYASDTRSLKFVWEVVLEPVGAYKVMGRSGSALGIKGVLLAGMGRCEVVRSNKTSVGA